MRRPYIQLLIIMMLTFQFTSCITTHDTNYMQAPKNFIPAYKDTVSYSDYRLKPSDKLFIQVYSLDEQTNALFNGSSGSGMQMMSAGSGDGGDLYSYIVGKEGNIQLPVVGAVYVQGQTLREARKTLEDAIKPVLKINSVNVRMTGLYFSVVGNGKSGRFAFPREKINVFQALALAGDFGTYTDRSKIRILRETENGSMIETFDLRSADIVHSRFYYLEPNDVIFLQPMRKQFFGVTTFWTAISTLVTTYSIGFIFYKSFIEKTPATTN